MPERTSTFLTSPDSTMGKKDMPSKVRKPLRHAPIYGNSSFTVIVGRGESIESFSIHQNRARMKSGFFEAAFRNEWEEAEEKLIRLPDYEPEHFHIFFLWLSGSTIYSSQDSDIGADENESVCPEDETDLEWERLAYA